MDADFIDDDRYMKKMETRYITTQQIPASLSMSMIATTDATRYDIKVARTADGHVSADAFVNAYSGDTVEGEKMYVQVGRLLYEDGRLSFGEGGFPLDDANLPLYISEFRAIVETDHPAQAAAMEVS